jgi:hypothetical protein
MRPAVASCLFAGVVVACLLGIAPKAGATVISEDELEGTSTSAGVVWRSFGFTLAGPVLAPPYAPEDYSPTHTAIFDTRAYLERKTNDYKFVAHPQLSLRTFSHELAGVLTFGRGLSPPRWLPLSYTFVDDATVKLSGQFDRLYLGYTFGPATLTLGRQAVTFGRGKLWRTSDVVSTFSLTEIDTEYKPGSDALRLDIHLGDASDVTLVVTAGELESGAHDAQADIQGSSALIRYQHGGRVGEIGAMLGMVRGDVLLSLDATLDFGSLDSYAEVTLVYPTKESLGAPATSDRPILKGLLGATLKPAPKLTVSPELMYSGFGAWRHEDYLQVLLSERVAIGEQTSIGRMYAGVALDVEMHPLWHLVSAQIVNLGDPSGLFSLALKHSLADNAEVLFGAYAPMGKRPNVGLFPTLRSEFGSYPYFFFSELKGVL